PGRYGDEKVRDLLRDLSDIDAAAGECRTQRLVIVLQRDGPPVVLRRDQIRRYPEFSHWFPPNISLCRRTTLHPAAATFSPRAGRRKMERRSCHKPLLPVKTGRRSRQGDDGQQPPA